MTLSTLRPRQQLRPRASAQVRPSPSQDYLMKLIPHLALEEFIAGNGALRYWDTLAFRLRLTEELARRHSPNVLPDIQNALRLLDAIYLLGGREGDWSMSGQTALGVGTCLWYADCLQALCTGAMQHAALEAMLRANLHQPHRIGLSQPPTTASRKAWPH